MTAALLSFLLTIPFYDIPLDRDLQAYTHRTCITYQVDPAMVYAIMWQESRFTEDIISSTSDYGIMQINRTNHGWLSEVLGITDFLNPRQNIKAGIYMLSICEGDDNHETLMNYNIGKGGANKLRSQGINETEYSRAVIEKMKGFERIDTRTMARKP